jgi:hypothetical protein
MSSTFYDQNLINDSSVNVHLPEINDQITVLRFNDQKRSIYVNLVTNLKPFGRKAQVNLVTSLKPFGHKP